MALESRYHNQYNSPQIITNNSEFVKIDEAKLNNPGQMGCANPFATTRENLCLGLNHQYLGRNNMMIQPQTNLVKVETGLSDNIQNGPNKRSRESIENQFNHLNVAPVSNNVPIQCFAQGNNFPNDVQHCGDIDYILSKFNKNINLEFETQQVREVKFMMANVISKFMKRVKTQREQISRMTKENMALQDKMKSLYAETQLWKDIANTANITTMSLRKDFDNILGKVSKLNSPTNTVAVEEDAESCYGSTGKNNQEVNQGTATKSDYMDEKRMCKKCGERESSVLLLPCRHLCLCSVCGGSVQAICPVCKFCIATTVHVCLT